MRKTYNRTERKKSKKHVDTDRKKDVAVKEKHESRKSERSNAVEQVNYEISAPEIAE